MEARLVRLAEKTSGEPFFASDYRLHHVARFRPVDFLDAVAVVDGAGWHVSYAGDGEPRVQMLHSGQMVLYRPTDDVMLAGKEPAGMLIRYVSFPAAEWRIFASMVGVDPSWSTAAEPPLATFDLADTEALQPFDAAIHRFQSAPTSLDIVQFWIDVIPLLFPASHQQLPGAGAPDWLVDSVEAMRQEENLRGGVRRMLELAHVSAAHLSVTTRRYFGKTPTVLVTELRLRHAAVLLSTTTESIGVIARRCGFASVAYFSTCFRRQHYLTPREYRARSFGRFAGERR